MNNQENNIIKNKIIENGEDSDTEDFANGVDEDLFFTKNHIYYDSDCEDTLKNIKDEEEDDNI